MRIFYIMTTTRPAHGYRSFLADTNMNYQLNRFLGAEPSDEVFGIAATVPRYDTIGDAASANAWVFDRRCSRLYVR